MHVHAHCDDGSAGHSHHAQEMTSGVLAAAVAATSLLVVAELLGGYLGHSISLVSDALHNLSDIPTLLISWIALHWAVRPADHERTYGYQRAGVLAAFTNAILLVLVSVGLFYEAFERFLHPVAVHESWMIGVSLLALAINGGITLALVSSRRDLNLRSLLVHNFGDAISNIGILVGAIAIHLTGAQWLDPMIGVVIAALVLWSTKGLLQEAGNILLEGLPRGIKLESVAKSILAVKGIQEVHDIHIWTIGTNMVALSCHARIPDMHMDESEKILREVCAGLERDFHITHITVQFERAGLPQEAAYIMPQSVQSAE
ncbi:MAG TPA: cation diffusion facilitator family transporter [Candidatus Saccharimonadales bacterium]|jgi:cobalt-zinc-cadmium efflux system protein|nr:cation diffusion facilitator family transporter [Candidatus Saccharimonadales bacterium]